MNRPAERLRILVLGYVVRCPLGGMAWHYAQYVAGLSALGHDVFFLEDSDDYAETCYDPTTGSLGTDATAGLHFADDLFAKLGLGDRWAYQDRHAGCWRGPRAASADELCATADMLVNVSGSNPARAWFDRVPIRVYIDTDPAFNQIRQLTNPVRRERALAHNRFFSFGSNIGQPGCPVPTMGVKWHPTRQPVVLDLWRVTQPPSDGSFTTVMQWDSFASVSYEGASYGMKSQSFREFLELPSASEATFELALGSKSAPRDLLRRNGWRVRNPLEVTADAWKYRDYIESSLGEFSVAKHGYVATRCGWFSERSAAYLASGRPVITQNTGFDEWLSADAGLLSFTTLEQAVDGARRVMADPLLHHRAARQVARDHFDSAIVLSSLIETATSSTMAGTHDQRIR